MKRGVPERGANTIVLILRRINTIGAIAPDDCTRFWRFSSQ
jgi:hypothetical protein